MLQAPRCIRHFVKRSRTVHIIRLGGKKTWNVCFFFCICTCWSNLTMVWRIHDRYDPHVMSSVNHCSLWWFLHNPMVYPCLSQSQVFGTGGLHTRSQDGVKSSGTTLCIVYLSPWRQLSLVTFLRIFWFIFATSFPSNNRYWDIGGHLCSYLWNSTSPFYVASLCLTKSADSSRSSPTISGEVTCPIMSTDCLKLK